MLPITGSLEQRCFGQPFVPSVPPGPCLPGDWEERDFSVSGELAGQLRLMKPLFVIHHGSVVQA